MVGKLKNTFTYIIGNNGSGKSRTLASQALDASKNNDVVVISSSVFDKFQFKKKISHNDNGSYRYLGARTVGNAIHHGTVATDSVFLYLSVLHSGLKEPFLSFLNKVGFDKKVYMGFRKTKSSKLPDFEPFNITLDLKSNEILNEPGKPFQTFFYKKGNGYSFSELSSGEQHMITTALKLLATINNNIYYFIDEPEISLHVEWQVKWPELFHPLLLEKENVSCHIATHSPVIISSALQSGAICYLLNENGLQEIIGNEFNVEGVIYNNFNTATPHNKYIFEDISKLINNTIEHLNESSNVEPTDFNAINDLVFKFEKKIKNASCTSIDSKGLNKIISDLNIVISDLITMSKKIDQ